jgi:alkanesulfonate monooxygenase SsuD/methylene tetrahydromethanopterin reductase-like flavin-dependent oxidoreductase (luciferase family)
MKELKVGLALDYLDPALPLRENFEVFELLVQEARDAGFAVIYQGHHFMESGYPRLQPLPLLSSFASVSGEMALVWSDILPLNNPVRVAEELATLDVITDGRAVLLGVLGYQRREYEAFGVEYSGRGARVSSMYEAVARLLAGERVTMRAAGFDLDDAVLGGMLRPVSDPRPAIWMTAHNNAGVKRAGRHGDVWFISHQPTVSELRDQIGLYRSLRAEREPEEFHRFDSHGIELPLLREAFVAPTSADAIRLAAEPMMQTVAHYRHSDQITQLNDPEGYLLPFDEWRVDRVVLGDPDEVTDELRRYRDELGVDCVVLKLLRQGIPLDHVIDAVRLVGEHVIPRLRADAERAAA